jgi:hypothetical protein
MYKKIVIALLLFAVVFIPVSTASAKPKAVILIEDLVYTIKEVPALDSISINVKGQLIYAEGEGVINCNGVEACEEAGWEGQTVTIKQVFTGISVAAAIDDPAAASFKAATAGKLDLPGENPAIFFKGKGDGTIECSDGTCDLAMELDTQTKGGAKLSYSLVAINIDHTSAGIVCDSFGGEATLTR